MVVASRARCRECRRRAHPSDLEDGICVTCWDGAIDGDAPLPNVEPPAKREARRADGRQRARRRRQLLHALGLCTHCGNAPALWTCRSCQDTKNGHSMRRRHAFRAAGICLTCEGAPSGNYTRCDSCRARDRELARQRRHNLTTGPRST